MASLAATSLPVRPCPSVPLLLAQRSSSASSSPSLAIRAASSPNPSPPPASNVSRRDCAVLLGVSLAAVAASAPAARAEFLEDYKRETEAIIAQLRKTLTLDKSDPTKVENVDTLRGMSNNWVAKYRREKAVGGKASFGNLYSALNAISGHYISFGSSYPIPKKRQDRILEEVADAERQLARGR